ncbi:diguanylate cyclase domain-containing protein [Rhizobium tubonense]|uniref:diguanylate cyclase domain-containing protein n=1 Tax=Rhizobium tubonense TaxID=484088 RepID=UPI001FCE4462|nr:diguanylate cyclase [Rhizobium tubonense]
MRFVIEMLPQAVCVFDAEDRYVLWNEKYTDLYTDIAAHLRPGIPFEDILKISLASGEMQELVDDQEAWLRQRLEKHRMALSHEEQQLRDGRWLRHDDRRTPDGAIGMRIDITELKQREEWLRQLFDANPMPMLLCDPDTLLILEANVAAVSFYGHSKPALLSMRASDMHIGEQEVKFGALLHDLTGDCEANTVWTQLTAGGDHRHVLIYVRFLREGGEHRLLLTVADVSKRVHAETQANHLAHHDALTGLPNRMQFHKVLEDALQDAAKTGTSVTIHYLDLDAFKPVNDTFGHAVGDEVLKVVAERLRTVAGAGNIVARLGGDEFAIIQTTQDEDPRRLAEQCILVLEEPMMLKGLPIKIGASVGVAMSPQNGTQADDLLNAADRALYRAKADGKNTWCIAADIAA